MNEEEISEAINQNKNAVSNWLLRENALENLARLYEIKGSKRRAITTLYRLALNPLNYDETRYRAFQSLERIYSERKCGLREKLCQYAQKKILEARK